MVERKIQVFFYGALMSSDVMQSLGIKRRAFAPAQISGYELIIGSSATLVDSGDGIVYGILANLTHTELKQVYESHTSSVGLAGYVPEPVLVQTRGGKVVASLTYIMPEVENAAPRPGYVEKILEAAKSYGFPAWYRTHIQRFLPQSEERVA